ncbi:hypothetical protein D3C85_1074220 [compost metagenome]
MCVEVAAWHPGEAGIEIGHEGRGIGVGCVHRADPAQAQLLHQAVLQRAIHPFHTALGLAVLQRQTLRDLAPLAPAEDPFQVFVATQRSMGVKVAARHLAEARVEVRHEGRRVGVGGFHAGNLPQPQFLDQPVLQRAIHPFHAALGLARVGAHDVDVELVQGSPELGVAPAFGRVLLVDAENPSLVGIERLRLAVAR